MWVSPFRDLRIDGYLLLPEAFRSLSRLSSALSAKASSLRPYCLTWKSRRKLSTVEKPSDARVRKVLSTGGVGLRSKPTERTAGSRSVFSGPCSLVFSRGFTDVHIALRTPGFLEFRSPQPLGCSLLVVVPWLPPRTYPRMSCDEPPHISMIGSSDIFFCMRFSRCVRYEHLTTVLWSSTCDACRTLSEHSVRT